MVFHEKTLELNITHELLNLTDSWYWFLTDIPLWRYWRPRYRLPFLNAPKSTAGGFHITTEGKKDSTGENGGGYDVRIKAGVGSHLLFIQYKLGNFVENSPNKRSIFEQEPQQHYKFEINSTSTNQHFTLRDLSSGIGSKKGNAVVYAFPLISTMDELEKNAGNLLRKTKFISITDIDKQATFNKVPLKKYHTHNFRIGKFDMNRCEVNYFYHFYKGPDRTFDIIADTIAIGFEKNLRNYIKQVETHIEKYRLNNRYLKEGIKRAFGQYLRFLMHHFEINPTQNKQFFKLFHEFNLWHIIDEEFNDYETTERDFNIINSVFNSLEIFRDYINNPLIDNGSEIIINKKIPNYQPSVYLRNYENRINLNQEVDIEAIKSLNCLAL